MKKIVASIQVRMGSSRYPGKVMQEICGKPMIEHLINRLQYSLELMIKLVFILINHTFHSG